MTKGSTMTHQRDTLIQRLRALLANERSTREVSMFGGRSFMVNDKMIVSALKHGDLLVRVHPERDSELREVPGASPAEMGAGRPMGPGWISASADSISSDEQLTFWLDVALEYNQTTPGRRR